MATQTTRTQQQYHHGADDLVTAFPLPLLNAVFYLFQTASLSRYLSSDTLCTLRGKMPIKIRNKRIRVIHFYDLLFLKVFFSHFSFMLLSKVVIQLNLFSLILSCTLVHHKDITVNSFEDEPLEYASKKGSFA